MNLRLLLVAVALQPIFLLSAAVSDDSQPFKRGDTVTVMKDGAEFVLPGKPSQKLPLGTKITVMRTTDRSIGGFALIDGERSPGWIRISDVQRQGQPQGQPPNQPPKAKPADPQAPEGSAATDAEPVAFQIEHRPGMIHHDLEFSPDGKLLLSAGMYYESPELQIWATADGSPVRKLEGKRWGTRKGAFSPDSKLVATANHGIRMWRVESGELVWGSLELSPVHRVQFSPDGKTLAVGGAGGKVLLLDAATGERRSEIQAYSGWTFDLQFTDGGSQLVTIGVEEPRSGAIKVWEVATGKRLSEIGPGQINANDMAISPDEKRAVTWSNYRELRVWDLETGKPVDASWGDHQKILRAVAWSPDGRVIARPAKTVSSNCGTLKATSHC